MNDDNEEVFRRAAENYPLNTDTKDWESVLKKMNHPEVDGAVMGNPNKPRKRWLLLLLFLLPFAVISTLYLSRMPGNEKTASRPNALNEAATARQNSSRQLSPSAPLAQNQTHSSLPAPPSENENIKGSSEAQLTNMTGVRTQGNGTKNINADHPAQHKNIIQAYTPGIAGKNITSASQPGAAPKNNEPTNARKKSKTAASRSQVLIGNAAPETDPSTAEGITQTTGKEASAGQPEKNNDVAKSTTPPTSLQAGKDPVKDPTSRVEKETKAKSKRSPHFYAGIFAGPDFSSIKMQAVKKAGSTYGFFVGYRINKHFAIESGLAKDHKQYSSDGQYFSRKNIRVPSSAKIEDVKGSCNMLEWPVNVHYNLSAGKKTVLFGNAGVSSYFMKKERYTFDMYYSGYSYPYTASYKKHYNAFLSVVNLGVGVEQQLGRIGKLRIEPYVKLPVKKIGTGELPIQSAGVVVGFVRNIF